MDVSVRRLIIVLLVGCATVGCRQGPDPSIELLESELRWMEDQLYAMDHQLDQTELQLASCRRNNASLSQELSSLRTSAEKSSPSPTPAATAPKPPGASVPRIEEFNEEDLQVPQIDLGPSPGSDNSNPAPPAIQNPASAFRDDSLRSAVNVQVARIVLNSRLTGGYDFDGQPGDEGLLVVIEPQNNAGQYVPLPGDLQVEVIDKQQSGHAARIARWNFEASELLPHMKQSLLGRGVHLQLPWPSRPPQSSQLQVSVAYRSPTGKTLNAQRDISVDPVLARQPPRIPQLIHVLPDQFVPSSQLEASQLLDDHTLVPPPAPFAQGTTRIARSPQNESAIRMAKGRQAAANPAQRTRGPTGRRPQPRAAGRVWPQWSPYR